MIFTDHIQLKDIQRCVQPSGFVAYFFGNTTIIVDESIDTDGVIHLTPIRGDIAAHGDWLDIYPGELAEYCQFLSKLLNEKGNKNVFYRTQNNRCRL